jgi:hypothetical protein
MVRSKSSYHRLQAGYVGKEYHSSTTRSLGGTWFVVKTTWTSSVQPGREARTVRGNSQPITYTF